MVENFGYNLIHIVVTIFGKATAKGNIGQSSSQRLILGSKFVIALVVDGIIGLGTGRPILRIFVRYHRVGLCAELEMLVFDSARVGCFGVSIVKDSVALEIVDAVHKPMVEAQRAEIEMSKTMVEPGIERTCV